MSTRTDRRPPRELVALRIEATVVMSLHIFSGVLFVVLATLLTSYLYRPGFVPADLAHPGRG